MSAPKDQQLQALLSKRAFRAPNLTCSSGFRIDRCCSNSKCSYDSLCCSEEQCKHCELLHNVCSFYMLRKLNKLVEERLFLHTKLLRTLFSIENQLMNKLAANRKQIIEKSKDWRLGQSNIIEFIYFQNNTKGLKGKQMKQLLLQLSQKSSLQTEGEKYIQSYRQEGKQLILKMEKLRFNLVQGLAKQQKKQMEVQPQQIQVQKKNIPKAEQKNQIPSKILKQDKQKYAFLVKQLKNPRELRLLFRASQHNFSAAQFRKVCNGIGDTVTILRTQFGKTIAAYTPLKWSLLQGFVADNNKLSFLLQLDIKERMNLIQHQKAIYNQPNYGPIFGGSHDLWIADRCNTNKYSGSNFPTSYNSTKNYQNNQQSYALFCGNLNGHNFKVVEYEVFAVIR